MQANKTKVIHNLRIAKGQIEGIIKMIDEDRYCLDIFDQISATKSILVNVNQIILEEHLRTCVKQAILDGDDKKLEEAIKTFKKLK